MTAARVFDERELWDLATAPDEYHGFPAIAWFESHLEIDWTFNCWVWTACSSRGYGRLDVQGRTWRAHRFSYEIHRGSTYGLDLDHLCRNTLCVNPWHLEPISKAANNRRARAFRSTRLLKSAAQAGFQRYKAAQGW